MRGDGSIVQARDDNGKPRKGVWRVTVSGRDALTGRRTRRTRIVHGTKTEAAKVRDALVEEAEGGFKPKDAAALTFGEFARDWLQRRQSSGDFAERTLSGDSTLAGTLITASREVRLSEFSPHVCEQVMQAVRDMKPGISKRTELHYFVCLRQILADGVRLGVIRSNPCDSVRPPKPEPSSRKAMDADEAARLRGELVEAYRDAVNIYDRSRTVGALLALASGIRFGEMLGLRWSDVSPDCLAISISKATTITGHVKEPKSRAGFRRIALGDDTAALLDDWRRAQAAHLGARWSEDVPVVSTPQGAHTPHSTYQKWFKAWTARHGFEGATLHRLRHTVATQLIGAGVDVRTVSARLGHAQCATTLDVYSHAISERDEEAAQVMERILAPKGGAAIRYVKSA